jgi:hypothetical protein
MGGGPDREHMLIVLRSPESKGLTAKIKERFPYIDVTYFQIKSTRANNVPEEKDVPKGSYLLALLIVLPISPHKPFSLGTTFLEILTIT